MALPAFDEALDYAKKRKIVLPQEFYDPKNKDRRGELMTVSNLAGLSQIQAVTDDLMKALENGETFEDWQQRALATDGVVGLPPGRTETVFRNYMQTAYNGGRWSQFERNKKEVPYLMFSAINDARTTDICRYRNGIIRPVDDDFWKSNSPMLHHRSILPGNRICGKVYSALKARYSGPAIEVIGESGCRFTVTAQHPILTDQGWVFSDQLTEGMNLVSYRGIINGCSASPDADKNNAPPKIEQIFETLGKAGRVTMPRATLDLHGDEVFIQSDVDIVTADRRLMAGYQFFFDQQVKKFLLALAYNAHRSFKNFSAFFMRSASRFLPRARFPAQVALVVWAKMLYHGLLSINHNSVFFEMLGKGFRAHSELSSDRLKWCSAFVEGDRLFWDASLDIGSRNPASFVSESLHAFLAGSPSDSRIIDIPIGSASSNSEAYRDICDLHAGLIERDRIVSLRRFNYNGHVYDLHTKSGYIIIYNGGGLKLHSIVSNCRSTLVGLTKSQAWTRSGSDTGLNKKPPQDPVPDGWGRRPFPQDQAETMTLLLAEKLKNYPKSMWARITDLFINAWSLLGKLIKRLIPR